ncbi:ATPase AAA [Clostridium carboxidivorans P7]|uniref:sigma-54 interaction domain-containing protein n=1 Tax=Clostridium carboxidivorans TaxID=217159 RepID=UPI0001D394B5|nr:sigma 54-interacting transcriptional regulator [Clostridium carboxidivorans]AKN30601.1 ATPase AAA [Clostridium carboxidivorans P7]EFG86353.1 sigma-54 interaction domain protein [Clostridium carboxidivorans P7]
MKTIGIVTNNKSSVASFIRKNLEDIFKNIIKINNYYISDLKDDYIIKDDVVLFMTKEKSFQCEKNVLNKENIIVIERTLKGSEIYKIFTLPKNTKVLVVNDDRETTMEMASSLHHIGVNDLELIPYEEDKNYEDIKIAITPDEEEYVPDYINTIINVGNRHIDMSTFLKIMNKFNIEDKNVSERLIKYSDNLINLNAGIKDSYKELFVKKEELDMVLNISKEGVLLINNEETIIFCNNAFKNIFDIYEDVKGKKIASVLDANITEAFRCENLKDEILEFRDKKINANKQVVQSLSENIGFCFNLQEVTYIKQLEQNLNKKLRNKGLVAKYNFDYIKTCSTSMKECINLARKIASSDLTALIIGESGTGKELLAQSIHSASPRAKQPFVAINCAALPENLLESELFGYEGGSFTGALKEGKIGLFEQANNGTIFLDEIGDMPLSLQARILRVLQERQVMRIGSQSVIDINVRVISATNRKLMEMVDQGKFREDLFYRLNVLPINIPPLRERKDDIISTMKDFITRKELKISDEVKNILLNYRWPGNVRELQNVAAYIELMSDSTVNLENLPFYILNKNMDFERELQMINSKCNLNNAVEIIKIVEEKNHLNEGVGRKNIEAILKERYISVTEAEVRRILTILNGLNLITSSVGRKGSEITVKGKKFIEWVKNRID